MAFYDRCDYLSYWHNRDYENKAEVIALKSFFKFIPNPQKKVLVDIGAGFGRHAPVYQPLFKSAILIDPSQKLLKQAKKLLVNHPHLSFRQGSAEKIPLKNASCDIVLLVRVIHHLPQINPAFKEINRILKPGGFFLLEYANKIHLKARIKAALKGDFHFSQKKETIDRRSASNKNPKSIAFLNYHPQVIARELKKNGFEIISKRSVSNFRSPLLKKIIPLKMLLWGEKIAQTLLAPFNFGPSMFILARKNNTP